MTERDRAAWRPRLLHLGLAVLSGTCYFLGFAGFNQWYLAPAAVALFGELILRVPTARSALAHGFLMGLVTHLGGYYWIPGTLVTFGGFPWPVALGLDVLLCSWGALSFGLLGWGLKRWWMAGGKPFPSLPLALVFVEHAYPLLFPSYLANAFWEMPLLFQTADLGGVLLVSATAACFATALWLGVRWAFERGRFPRLAVAVGVALPAASLIYGALRIRSVDADQDAAPTLRVGIVQANLLTFQKREDPDEGLRRHVEDSIRLQARGDVDLILWPESAYVGYLPSEPGTDLTSRVMRHPRVEGTVRTPLLFGALRRQTGRDGRARQYNAAFLADGEGRVVGTHDKTHLLAFGEYLPFGETFPWLYEISPNSGRFSPGTGMEPLPFGGYRIGTLICYEDVLPGFTRRLVNATRPHLLVNITNDAWFGETTEPEIHLALAVFRAVEHRRWLVRATNSGISSLVDPVGRVTARTALAARETLVGTVHWMGGTTPYQVLGEWPGWLAALAVLWAAYRMWRAGQLRFRWRRRGEERGTRVKRGTRGG